MKAFDYIIIGLVAALSLLPLAFLPRAGGDALVMVTVRGETVYTGRLNTDAVIQAGDGNTVTVMDGHARMTRASCPDGVCLHGEASGAHPLVCLPNGVVVTVTSGEEAYDGLSY